MTQSLVPAAHTDAATPPPSVGPLGFLIDHPLVARFDEQVDSVAEVLRGNRIADRLFYSLSKVGDHGIIWHVIGCSRVILNQDTFVAAVALSSALGIEAAVVNGPVKMLFRRVRPEPEEPRPLQLRKPRTSSFPSGHASAGAFAAMLVADRTVKAWPWYLAGGLVGWSRVHVRIHHPSDVLGGFIVGWALGRLALRVIHNHVSTLNQ
ncbi:MAG TPA: hypothetical protein DEG43_00815 [Acidimicrobiaceae bacterium]|jgi:membrane-associated phospholipid phosphatase|nr:hypothetical protein [Acidimicrobiaceae bacterium]